MYLSHNPNVTMSFVLNNLDKNWLWYAVTLNPGIHIGDILQYQDLPWEWNFVSCRDDCTFRHILANPELPWNSPQNLKGPSRRVSFEDFKAFPDLPWSFYDLSFNPNIPLEYVIDNLDKVWDFYGICLNRNHTFEDIVKRINGIPWEISYNPNVVFAEHVVKNRNIDWNPYAISRHQNTRIEHIENHPKFPWDYNGVSRNPNVTMDFILRNLDKGWNWYTLTKFNSNIGWKDIMANRDLNWEWNGISANDNILEVEDDEFAEYVMKIIAVNRIKRQFRKSMADPWYMMCRKRLLGEFHDLKER
jgi:hypothetical protein